MPTTTRRFHKIYGGRLRHLLVLTGCFLVTGYALLVLGPAKVFNPDVWWQSSVVWFLGGAIFVDFVLFPLCAAADHVLSIVLRARRTTRRTGSQVPVVNYIRVPVLASGLLLLLFFPGIVEQGKGSYLTATGQTQEPFLGRWLWLTVLFCCFSALAYAGRLGVRRLRAKRSNEREHDE